jgi:hypothetical protein
MNDFQMINIKDIPRNRGKGSLDPLTSAVCNLPLGKGIKKEFPTRASARKKQRSLLSNLNFIRTRVCLKNERVYLYIWKKEVRK